VKINEITNEGFVTSFAKELLPEPLKKVVDTKDQKAEPSEEELAKMAYKKFGSAPDRKGQGWQGWLQYDQRANKAKAKKIAQAFADKERATGAG
jgi:hypothetical protein